MVTIIMENLFNPNKKRQNFMAIRLISPDWVT